MSFKEALSKIKTVASLLDDDDPDKLEMLNVEGDYTELMNWALGKIAENNAQADAAKGLIDKYTRRKKSFEGKASNMRDIIKIIMSCANERKFTSASGTVSLSNVKPKPIVTDESLVPDDYKKTTISIDKALINQAIKDGHEIKGVSMDNGGETVRITI